MWLSYQKTVEKNMAKDPQTADDEVDEVVEELKVHHHGFVASCEGSSIANKTYQEDYLITNLKDKDKLPLIATILSNGSAF